MSEINMKEGAVGFALPNDGKPKPYNEIFYGQTKVPTPTNAKAKVVPRAEVMRQVMEGK